MEVRFPGIDWFCDNCNAHLNSQSNFDDRKYIWKCKKCGYKNSISAANIRYKDPLLHRLTGFTLGILRSFFAYTLVFLFISEVFFHIPPFFFLDHRLLFLCIIVYILIMFFSLYFERFIAKYGIHKPLGAWIITTIPINTLGDLFRPFQEVLSFPFAMINLLRLRLKGISYKKYLCKKLIYVGSYFFLILSLLFVVYKLGLLEQLI